METLKMQERKMWE